MRRIGRAVLIPGLAIFTALLAGGVIIWVSGPKFAGEWAGLKFVWDGYSGLFVGAFGTQAAIIGISASPRRSSFFMCWMPIPRSTGWWTR